MSDPVRPARVRCNLRGLLALPALLVLLALLAAGCGAGDAVEFRDVALSSRDVPPDWVAADVGEAEARVLWDVLPEVLTSNAEARLLVRALQADGGRHGVATILIQTEEPDALPRLAQGDEALARLARLLERQDALLGPAVLGGDPGTYFASSDIPLPGSVRSRLVRLLDEGYLFSDSMIFSAGPVLAVVTVWYPEDDEPVRRVEELAGEVERRLQVYLDGS